MKFRKKPIIVDAEQWFHGKEIEGVENPEEDYYCATIQTLEGKLNVQSGDWIVTGIKGEKYPCKPDIFELTYDPIDQLPF